MTVIIRRALFTAALALGLPAMAITQEAAAADQQEVEGWLREMEQVHNQLESLQMQALQDPQLSRAQEQLGEDIRVAMERLDPAIQQRMARVEALEVEAVAAQQGNDVQKLQQLMQEAQQIQQHFMIVQQQVLEEPQIMAKVTDFQGQLERRMVEMNPQAQALISRFRELEGKLSAAMQSGA